MTNTETPELLPCEWQPIETAPKDGTQVRMICAGKEGLGRWMKTQNVLKADFSGYFDWEGWQFISDDGRAPRHFNPSFWKLTTRSTPPKDEPDLLERAAQRFNQAAEVQDKAIFERDTRIAELEHALELILPLAKGYNPPSQTQAAHKTCWSWIEVAERALKTPEGE